MTSFGAILSILSIVSPSVGVSRRCARRGGDGLRTQSGSGGNITAREFLIIETPRYRDGQDCSDYSNNEGIMAGAGGLREDREQNNKNRGISRNAPALYNL